MDEEIIYGMLMRKIQITFNHYIFIPVHLIEGITVSENLFTDDLGKDYYMFSERDEYNESVIYDQDEYCIGFSISKKDLQKYYPDDIIENAKKKFYDETKNKCLFAYTIGGVKFNFKIFDLKLLSEELFDKSQNNVSNNSEEKQDNPKSNKIVKENIEKLKDNESVVIMNRNVIEQLIAMTDNKDYNKLIETLKMFKNDLEHQQLNNDVNTNPKAESQADSSEVKKDDIDVKDFYLSTKKKIIDQDDALLDIITAVKMDQHAQNPSERSRCLIIGPTGSGKTKILECLGEYLNKPFIKVDTTQLTTPGYVGGTIEEQLSRLVSVAGGDLKKAENGIISFDEIDKKCASNDELFGKGFLFTLLPFLDGTDYTISVAGKRQIFNTSNLTVFASGSFLEIIKKHSLDKSSIGFNTTLNPKEVKDNGVSIEEIFKMSGMPDELVGRFPVVVRLNELTEQNLGKILTTSELSQLKAEKRKLKNFGVDLTWEEKYIEAVAKEAVKLNRGARSLKAIIERTVKFMRREILLNPGKYSGAELLEETVTNPKVYKLK